jgi:hypothetical protein
MGKNRASLLVELIRQNDEDNADLFDLLVPNCYGELYSLYCILKRSDVLDECGFDDPPILEDGLLTIRIKLSKDNRKLCMTYLESKQYSTDYLKKDRFDLQLTQDSSTMSITFVRQRELLPIE